VLCSYSVPNVRLDRKRSLGADEEKIYGYQDEERYRRSEIKFMLQLYSKPGKNTDVMVDLRLIQGHPIAFMGFAKRVYSKI
jgi:hypothetical protein